MMRRSDLLVFALLFLLGFGLRFHGVTYPPQRWMDENAEMDAAVHYWEQGVFEPAMWQHPPLRCLTAYAFMRVFGDNPYGWRMRNVLFGAAAAVLGWLLTFLTTASRRAALLAGLLLATDPLHVVLSRFAYEEIFGGAFFLGAVVLYLLHRQRITWLMSSAFLVGCALATKWYFLPGWLLILVLLLRENGNWRHAPTALFLGCTWVLLPLGVYVATYLPWFGRGYQLAELPEFVLNAYHSLQSMTTRYVGIMDTRTVFHGHMSALEWFVRPIVIGDGFHPEPDRWEFILYVTDLPIWGLTFPAMIAMVVVSLRKRQLSLALPAILFFATYLLFVFVKRPVFIYSAIPLIPFAFAAIAFAITRLSDRLGRRFYWTVVAAMLGWNLYLYPLVTAKRVPIAAYAWLVDLGEIQMH